MADGGDEIVFQLFDAFDLAEIHDGAADALRLVLSVAFDIAAQEHRHRVAVAVQQAALDTQVSEVLGHGLAKMRQGVLQRVGGDQLLQAADRNGGFPFGQFNICQARGEASKVSVRTS